MPIVPNVTCLGCGCTCDDIEIVSDGTRILESRRACALGAAWFGDGTVPARVLIDGRGAEHGAAIHEAAQRLIESRAPLVYLAPDLSCEAQREGVAIADALHARLDSVTSSTVMRSMLAQQERGRAAATLGEVRNRADTLVFWGIDPSVRYPRYWSRYAPEPAGTHVPSGRRSRTVVAVDVGDDKGPADADVRASIPLANEVTEITRLRAAIADVDSRQPGAVNGNAQAAEIVDLVPLLTGGKYVVIVADAEPDDASERDPGRAEALLALTQALNGSTRCALSTLRAGGNRSGADAVLTWQTGYPAAVDFMRGYPEYRPYDPGAPLRRGDVDTVLLLGSESALPPGILTTLAPHPCIVVGPRASDSRLPSTPVVIDTGVAGIHEAGTAIRMDDVPLPLRASVSGPPPASAVLAELRSRIDAALRTSEPPHS